MELLKRLNNRSGQTWVASNPTLVPQAWLQLFSDATIARIAAQRRASHSLIASHASRGGYRLHLRQLRAEICFDSLSFVSAFL
jgi:2-phospho-L-lactate guanylyltransferase (CobY/MobA/RfbA family)